MRLTPTKQLTEEQVNAGMRLVTNDGLAVETMVVLTGGTFLTALALKLGASNFQIGLLAALPTLTNIFQLFAIWLAQRYNNRRVITVVCTALARCPLIVIGLMPFLFSAGTTIQTLIFLLFFHYLFGSFAGATWNAWMKDLLPGEKLGNFYAQRTRLTQILNVTLSLTISLLIDRVKTQFPEYETLSLTILFLAGSVAGLSSLYLLIRTPEPLATVQPSNILKQYVLPLRDRNFRKLLFFNGSWIFAMNLATPFLTVYMLKTMGLSVFMITVLAVIAQLSGILFVRVWGRYSDRYSNKTVILICAPLYIAGMLAWAFTAVSSSMHFNLVLLAVINILTGIANSGINLSLNNLGIKLAPSGHAMVYLSAKNMLIALCSAAAPLLGGMLADFFATHQLTWMMEWKSPEGVADVHLLSLQSWNFFFVMSAIIAMFSIRLLRNVEENGEEKKSIVLGEMLLSFKTRLIRVPAVITKRIKNR
ncbi:MFS transporter [Chitinophaga rhizophila]|uniref:MFS transporter n=1 Tax=Chitinophaga rhizophila TaxID=2866212 RepID=A0ABS7G5U6_9BACT|nr:MFS transporter [Chitinophaga rhizophila]MBW8682771.1 MFS transporter [Chitinophaga rhizophila]